MKHIKSLYKAIRQAVINWNFDRKYTREQEEFIEVVRHSRIFSEVKGTNDDKEDETGELTAESIRKTRFLFDNWKNEKEHHKLIYEPNGVLKEVEI